ncbi:MAG: glycosyltransferase family 4 protein [Pyrinomonadaceae bacterium]|nr:glycosyltransferase family 4 protein [Pyrinomonadaceae bacterium]
MAENIHTARWINQLSGTGWDVHLFPAKTADLHPDLKNLTVHDTLYINSGRSNPNVNFLNDFVPFFQSGWPLSKGAGLVRRALSGSLRAWSERAWRLAQLIRRLQPDIIHSLEITTPGYLVAQAKTYLDHQLPPWLVSNWGSDIYLFSRLSWGLERIKAVMPACDYYICECQRDVELGRAFGFKGEILGVWPGAGGFDIQSAHQFRQPGPTSSRRLIALKGYQGYAGRALVGLRAIELCADSLRDYHIAVYSAEWEVGMAAELVAHSTGLAIKVIPSSAHEEILRLHGRARISIGLSIGDAASTSLLEAMLMGSFPIQSNTSCADEWLQDGESGLIVPPNDPEPVAAAIRRAVTDDALVKLGAEINDRVVKERLDSSVIRPQVIAMYEKVAAAHISSGKGR